jgi:hypothetical protein
MAHTPGPWKVEEDIFVYGNGLRIADVSCDDQPDLSGDAQDSNALLIASAPDLLLACKYALAWSIERSESGRKWTQNDQTTHERLAAAIAKAEGRV